MCWFLSNPFFCTESMLTKEERLVGLWFILQQDHYSKCWRNTQSVAELYLEKLDSRVKAKSKTFISNFIAVCQKHVRLFNTEMLPYSLGVATACNNILF